MEGPEVAPETASEPAPIIAETAAPEAAPVVPAAEPAPVAAVAPEPEVAQAAGDAVTAQTAPPEAPLGATAPDVADVVAALSPDPATASEAAAPVVAAPADAAPVPAGVPELSVAAEPETAPLAEVTTPAPEPAPSVAEVAAPEPVAPAAPEVVPETGSAEMAVVEPATPEIAPEPEVQAAGEAAVSAADLAATTKAIADAAAIANSATASEPAAPEVAVVTPEASPRGGPGSDPGNGCRTGARTGTGTGTRADHRGRTGTAAGSACAGLRQRGRGPGQPASLDRRRCPGVRGRTEPPPKPLPPRPPNRRFRASASTGCPPSAALLKARRLKLQTIATAEAAAEQGQSRLRSNAAPFEAPDARPLVSVVIIDVGPEEGGLDTDSLRSLNFPVTIAIDPTRPDAKDVAQAYRDAGFEVAILATGIPSAAEPSDLETTFQTYLASLPQAVAVIDTPVPAFQNDRRLARHMVALLGAEGLGLITHDKGLNPADMLAGQSGVPHIETFRVLDGAREGTSTILRSLERAASEAARQGNVTVVAHSYPETVTALLGWAQDAGKDVALAPASALLLTTGSAP